MNIPLPFPAVLAVAYWPATAAILVACAAVAYRARPAGLRVAAAIVAAVVIIGALAGAWLLSG